jgi:uncharacterized protein
MLRQSHSIAYVHSKVINNIQWLRKEHIPFNLEGTYTRLRLDNDITIVDLLKYYDTLGAKRADIVNVMAMPRSQLYLFDDLPKLIDLYTDAIDYWVDYKLNGGELVFGLVAEILAIDRKSDSRNNYCLAGKSYLAIATDGNVFPRHLLFNNEKYCMGNVADAGPLRPINGIFAENDDCGKCQNNRLCLRCVGKNEFYSGDIRYPYPQECQVKKAIVSRVMGYVPTA